jgi:acyl-CoA thioesterase FadM
MTVRFEEADPRGILFFGRILALAHRAFETIAVPQLVPRWEDWFLSSDFIVPIRHAEADFSRPMCPGRQYEVDVVVVRIGATSFETRTRFYERTEEGGHLCAETRVTQVFADAADFTKREIPREIRTRLEALRDPAGPTAPGGGTSPGEFEGSPPRGPAA